ncbi:hypothetical protein [Sphingobacterium sp. LRF_L2]|uniref:hypothetical protein n=1 Tax=Sphingobacterium sp. LRF_L2 TaxID=3369421 RepID=UPI003F624696
MAGTTDKSQKGAQQDALQGAVSKETIVEKDVKNASKNDGEAKKEELSLADLIEANLESTAKIAELNLVLDQKNQEIELLKDAISEKADLNIKYEGLSTEFNSLKEDYDTLLQEKEVLQESFDTVSKLNENKSGVITTLEAKIEEFKKSESTVVPEKKTTAVVTAVKDGIEREFPVLAWNNMPKGKGGWKQKVGAPKEAK